MGVKGLASQYWRPKIQSCQIGSKLKFHLLTNTFWFQNGQKRQNRTKIDEVLLHKHLQIFGILKFIQGVLIKVRHFWSDFDVFGHYGIRRYWFINEILILSRSDNLQFSASSTVRPKLWPPWGAVRFEVGYPFLVWGMGVPIGTIYVAWEEIW